jgi:hypothetical protein
MQGKGAPQDRHPHYVAKVDVSRVNHGQRAPLESKEIRKDPEEHALLAEFLADVLEFVRVNVSKTVFMLWPFDH